MKRYEIGDEIYCKLGKTIKYGKIRHIWKDKKGQTYYKIQNCDFYFPIELISDSDNFEEDKNTLLLMKEG